MPVGQMHDSLCSCIHAGNNNAVASSAESQPPAHAAAAAAASLRIAPGQPHHHSARQASAAFAVNSGFQAGSADAFSSMVDMAADIMEYEGAGERFPCCLRHVYVVGPCMMCTSR